MFSNETLSTIRKRLSIVSIVIICGAQLLDVMSLTGYILFTNEIVAKYNITVQQASWSLAAYTLTYGSFILVGGKLGDYCGHRVIFMTGMTFFAIASLICAVAQNIYVLFVFRAIQGIGAAFSTPTSYGMIAHNFEGRTQAIAFAVVGSIASLGATIGILVGGGFAESAISYRGLMYLAFGLSIMFAISIFFTVEETPSERHKLRKIDYPGAIIIVIGIVLVVLGFTEAPGQWSTAKFIAPLILGLFIIGVFGLYESLVAEKYFKVEPLIPSYVWKFRNLKPIVAMAPLTFSSMYVVAYVGTLQLLNLSHKSPIGTAIEFLPITISFAITCIVCGATFGKISPRWCLIGAELILAAAGAIVSRETSTTSYWHILFPGYVLVGIGSAMFMSTYINTVSNSAPLNLQGLVSGMCVCSAQCGIAIAFAIASSEIGNGFVLKNYQTAYYTTISYSGFAAIIGALFLKELEHTNIGRQKKKYEDFQDGMELPITEPKDELEEDKSSTDAVTAVSSNDE